jgi:serine/threonine-protein kinase
VYALGVVLYETLCGRAPFVAETEAATALARLHQDPMRPRNVRAGIPKPIEDVVLRAMAREPDDRYSSASAFRAALLAAWGGAPTPALKIAKPAPSPSDATHAARAVPRDHTPTSNPPTFVRTERGWLVPTVAIVLVAVALIVAGIVFTSNGSLPHLPGVGGDDSTAASGTPVTIAGASAFDPFGGGTENNNDARLAVDGNDATFWKTEGYNDPAIRIKPGVGLVVTLSGEASLQSLTVSSQTSGWTAEIYVAAQPAGDLQGWGDPVTKKDAIAAGATTFDLGGHQGGAVLIWFTNLGNGSPGDKPGSIHGQIAEVTVTQK